MKTITKIQFVLFMGLTLSLTSCSDDDSSGGGTPSGEYVKAKVDGQNFRSSTSFDATAASHPNASTLMVQGSDNNGKVIQLMIMNFNGEGTYNVTDMTNGFAQYGMATTQTFYSSAAGGGAMGEVEITLVDDEKVEGTFHFDGRRVQEGSTEMVEVTDGSFRANFQ
ncbi:DUF6252 family protein [Flavobacterium sp. MFBS3-15]|uniref:DUF6252 family protein n=1 Tax=Flavobacterium sp. MFBS3-15 TaxID=2989816 RepID=UPI002236118B|nr:DUF6252 family protein [Flavobacterium sp. MFBS3-15]MCW4469517.1 DUF6252 family protein [Flavobacterium sp. MFBS3-15]